jgi:hypothetical protein
MTDEEREQLFGEGVIIVGGKFPRSTTPSLASEHRDSVDAASRDDERNGSPINCYDKLPLGNKNE